MSPAWTLLSVEPQADEVLRVDRVVQRALNISRREARTLVAEGRVRVQNKSCKIATRPVLAHTRVEVRLGETEEGEQAPEATPMLKVLYSDTWVVVIDKPAGLLSESDRFGAPSVISELPKLLGAHPHRERLWLVHRLDAGTSGVMILARTPTAAHRLGDAFRLREVEKCYWALAGGSLSGPKIVTGAIGRVQGTRHGVRTDGRPAETRVVPLKSMSQATFVEARPLTGRTHQIRVHLAHLGHPLLGDRLYGGVGYDFSERRSRIARPMLHARSLRIAHPTGNQALDFQAPLPDDFARLEATLFKDA